MRPRSRTTYPFSAIVGQEIYPEYFEKVSANEAKCVDGHRADLSLIKVTSTYAATRGRKEVLVEDVAHVSKLIMPHRMRRNTFQDSNLDTGELEKWLKATIG